MPLALAMVSVGCGGGSGSSAPPGLPTPAVAGPFNTYVGTSPFDSTAYGANTFDSYNGYGLWSVWFNHSNSTFNVWDVTTDSNNTDHNNSEITYVAGTFNTAGGMMALTQTSDQFFNTNPPPAGFAFEIPGRVAVLRQGDTTIPPTALVPTGCPSIGGATKFNFVTLPTDTWASNTDPAYGSVLIANGGATWNLTSYQLSTLAGSAAPNSGTALPAGTCASTAVGTTVYVPSDTTLPLPKTVAVGPSGFYIVDQGADSANASVLYPGEFGVIQPAAQLITSNVVTPTYLGFIYEPGADCCAVYPPETQMASFSASTPSGQLVGGPFPNDDPTQKAINNFSIDLGAQDATANGLYPNAVITNQITGTPYSAVAVAGNPEGKYAIFIIAEDTDFDLPLGMYLFQQ